jgi:diguanylate cyclase (GGDEF)-like protein
LRHDALHDPLTGLPNRALLLDRLGNVLARAHRRGDERVALLHLDLDGFQQVNDSLGHPTGDRLLVEIGRRAGDRLRPGDTAARLGSDEFALLLEEIRDAEDVRRIADDLARRIRTPLVVDGEEIVVSAAVGAALSDGAEQPPGDLLRNAAMAMHHAKTAGPNGFALFAPEMHTAALVRRELETELRRSVAGSELRVQFQPIVDLATGRVRSAEALVRWQHPVRGLISPLEFIPLAERTGVIHELDRWVLEQALAALAGLRRDPAVQGGLSVSVNLSPHRLRERDLVSGVERLLEARQVPPQLLTLEVTESALLGDSEVTVAALRRLKEMGVRLAIDDFGAGYSSLTYLTICDFDVLKIDRAFVAGMFRGGEGGAIARAILAMARILDLQVVAEGVEDAAQARRLAEMDCQLGQGNYFSPPLDIGELGARLRRQPGAETRRRAGAARPRASHGAAGARRLPGGAAPARTAVSPPPAERGSLR